jgi:hypothetical protein
MTRVRYPAGRGIFYLHSHLQEGSVTSGYEELVTQGQHRISAKFTTNPQLVSSLNVWTPAYIPTYDCMAR